MKKKNTGLPAKAIRLPRDREYLDCVRDILRSPEVRRMNQYMQHGNTTCLQHCLNVSYRSYRTCRRLGLNYRSAARAGLLHDLFLYDWHNHYDVTGDAFHGLTHPRKALRNAKKIFALTDMEQNAILRHMWPLTLIPPRYREAYVVIWYDKHCGVLETFHRPVY